MTRPLSAFDGDAIYLDAMILVGLIDAYSTWYHAADRLFKQASVSVPPIRLVTATLTLDETVFILLEELVARPPYGITRSRSQYLGGHPEVVRELMGTIEVPIRGLMELLSLEPVLPEDVAVMGREMATTGLLPRDALHVAVMRRLGVTALASDDDAFDRCAGITRFGP